MTIIYFFRKLLYTICYLLFDIIKKFPDKNNVKPTNHLHPQLSKSIKILQNLIIFPRFPSFKKQGVSSNALFYIITIFLFLYVHIWMLIIFFCEMLIGQIIWGKNLCTVSIPMNRKFAKSEDRTRTNPFYKCVHIRLLLFFVSWHRF